MISLSTDIVIVGAGVAGCIAAIALATKYSVVLIDKLPTPPARIGECLPPAARRILNQLDLLAQFDDAHLISTGMQSCWGSEQVHIVDHLRNPDGMGWHLDRQAFEVLLRQTAVQRGVRCLWPQQLISSQLEGLRWNIVTRAEQNSAQPASDDTYHMEAKFVIDAAGRQSPFAKQQGGQRQPFDKLISCWATLPNHSKDHMGLVAATESGWWYSAPLPNNQRVVALQTDADLITRGLHKDPQLFIHQAQSQAAIAKTLVAAGDKLVLHGIVSANSTRLAEVGGQQWVALGDAATSFDPLSSQGMFNAMACGMQLSELLGVSQLLDAPNIHLAGQVQAAYSQQIEQVWQQYLHHKKFFYGQEKRWSQAPFWHRRQG